MSGLAIDQQFYMVVLCQGQTADGKDYWAYLQIKPSKAKPFKQVQASGQPFNLEDYGTIVEWGHGADVPEDVKARMEAEGANHQFEEEVVKVLDREKDSYQLRAGPVSRCTKSDEE